VNPAALERDAVQDGRQGQQQPATTIDADHVEPFAGEPWMIEIGEERLDSAALSLAARESR
jgi:hypothetical protein